MTKILITQKPSYDMSSIALEYTDLSSVALVKIFQVADILGITPREAVKFYLAAKAKPSPISPIPGTPVRPLAFTATFARKANSGNSQPPFGCDAQ